MIQVEGLTKDYGPRRAITARKPYRAADPSDARFQETLDALSHLLLHAHRLPRGMPITDRNVHRKQSHL